MTALRVRASAKVNLHLGVGRVREDGFHPLHTVYQAISLHDDLVARPADDWSLASRAASYVDASALPAVEDDLVTRAARLLAAEHGVPVRAAVELDKAIPVAGGLAGGSADAAAALVLLDALWELGTPRTRLLELAADLGSDVPFALVGGTALGTGRGEVVEPVPDPGQWRWVVVPSREGLSTPAVYRHFDEMFPDASSTPPAPDALLGALAGRDPRRLAATLHNGLQEPAFDLRPDLRDLVARGEAEGALRGLVSGSGPTCVFLCEDEAHQEAVAAALRGAGHESVLTAVGPAYGATILATDDPEPVEAI
ncbi:4-(cytidine 5'-diphospho)-2-C-methyl-D-erythritol kinase [Nocardioides sp. GCM10027113]|uniref:4-(cytidine 5'-diphospho)-2-C-methyl-D-erythritol kinase n=1 Tax=unclassified Nocardioides TaxID=2615069 RepID=UPI00361DE370